MPDHNYFSNLIWQIADLLRGPYRPPQYERVMLPMTVLRRFDSVLAPTKARVLAEFEARRGGRLQGDALDTHLNNAAGQRFHNHSPLDFEKLKGDPDNIEKHLVSYIKGFSKNVRDIFDFFEFEAEIERMREANILYLVVSKFCDVDLHPNAVPNEQMGLIFENLIRRFNELANETAGDHFTPREVIRLMVSILFIDDDKLLATPGTVRKLLDPACGTGGMLAEAQNYLREHHGAAKLYVYGQDYNKHSLGDKRRHITASQIVEIVKLYGRHNNGETSRTFDNADFGYTRVTVERPLRLRYQMTLEDKARFLDACPQLLDDVQAIDKALGREPQRDWNALWSRIEDLLHARKSRWKASEQKLFRSVFTQKEPEAEPVAKGGRDDGYEPDADLRDFENVPLKDDIDAYFEREVRPHVPDAWMDRAKDKVGYEINFNRHFYKYTPPRPLEVIDAELKQAEEEIMRLLREVTE